MANRYYLESMLDEKTAILSQEETHHITKVMRKKVGDQIELLDGENRLFQAKIVTIEEQKIRAEILEVESINRELAKKVFLVQGLCKGDKMDFIVQKATELGVAGIYPVSTRRTEIRLNEEKAQKKQERWQKIAKEATKQCRRGTIPIVNSVMGIKDFLAKQRSADCAILAFYEDEKMTSIRTVLPQITEEYLYIIVGPEGGFDLKEVEWMKSIGVRSVSLGNRTLRTETAGILGIGCVYYEFGDQQ